MSVTDAAIHDVKPASKPYKKGDGGGLYIEGGQMVQSIGGSNIVLRARKSGCPLAYILAPH